MLSLMLIFRNFHLAARGADRWRQVPQPTPQPSEFVWLTAGTSRIEPSVPCQTTKVSREGSCRLSSPQRRRRRDETRYHDDGGVFRGTDGSNPASSSAESATNLVAAGGVARGWDW